MRIRFLLLILPSFLFVFGFPIAGSDLLMISQFNEEKMQGANFTSIEIILIDEKDLTQFCEMSLDSEQFFGDHGKSLRLDYDIDSARKAASGVSIKLKSLDLTSYRYINFYVKGDAGKGYPKQFKIEMLCKGSRGMFNVDGVTDSWTKFKIPLKKIRGLDTTQLATDLNFIFDDEISVTKVGTIFIDNLFFSS